MLKDPPFDDSIFSSNGKDPAQLILDHVADLAKSSPSAVLVDDRVKVKPFPLQVLPKPLQDIVRATNKTLSFPIDYTAASMMYVASIAIGNTHRIEVKRGYVDGGVLYMAIVGLAGVNKSHPLSFALAPLTKADNATFLAYQKEKLEFDEVSAMSSKERKEQGLDNPQKPVLKKFIISDATPEALVYAHSCNLRGIGMYVDELAGWFKNFNRYNQGSEQEFWLSTWSGKPITIDRKTSEPVRISSPFISVCGTIQTGILNEMAKDGRGLNGFLDRILMVIPEGLKKEPWRDVDIDQTHIDNWSKIIRNLTSLSYEFKGGEPACSILKFTPDARKMMFEYQANNSKLVNKTEDESLRGAYSKLDTHCVRLSLVLQMLRFATGEDKKDAVGVDAVTGAIELSEYFKTNAERVIQLISSNSPLDSIGSAKKQFYQALPDPVVTSDAYALGKKFKISQSTIKRMLNDRKFFSRIKRGEYEKKM